MLKETTFQLLSDKWFGFCVSEVVGLICLSNGVCVLMHSYIHNLISNLSILFSILGFIRKVYGILLAQIFVTMAVMSIFMYV